MPTLPLPTAAGVDLQVLRATRSRAGRWRGLLLLLTAAALLLQGIAQLVERSTGPAHLHTAAAAVAALDAQAHELAHARGIAHHVHDPADPSVLAADDDAEDSGPSGATPRLALDHAATAVVGSLAGVALAAGAWAAGAAARFVSRTTLPLDRPPR